MTTTIKSTSVTNLDAANPNVYVTAGEGAKAALQHIGDTATAAVSDGTGVQIIKLVRIPSTAKVKAVFSEGAALTKGTFDLGVYYSGAADGTPSANAGTAVSAALFASAVDFSSAVARTDKTNESGTYTVDKRTQPIWKAAGLSTDPGGFFDIAYTQNAITVTVGGLLSVEVEFTV